MRTDHSFLVLIRNKVVTKFVRKEGSGQGWLVKTRVNFIHR